ncbi:Helicase [Macleaya cordata]|uniref:RNA helicase n=1 Tax=Macleaya cordata TaxID=56857 RepID=A0A200RBJ4_MACCD|nr:Helicase [Macleaya cordata]
MDKPTSFLFSGIHFNRKKFANDFARFNERKESENSTEMLDLVETVKHEPEEELVSGKKRKRKSRFPEKVEGFSVFKSSESEVAIDQKEKTETNIVEEKKEVNRQIERDALLRKKHGIHISGHNVPSPLQNFAELSSRYTCKPYLLHNLAELGFREPTPIQRQAIPVLLSGRECFACAATGSGKTLAFLFPILMKLQPGSKDGVRAVILCPTRELAAQTTRECKKLAKGKKFYIKLMTKELVKNGDFKKMHCDILVSTPRRLQFAIRKRKLDLSRVEYLVLDESDKLFELGFVKQIDLVVKACSNPSIIRSLFSATLPDSVEELARTIMHDAVRVIVGRKNSASELIKQKLVFTGSEEGKLLALRQSFAESLNPPVLVFVQSKERAKELYRELAFDNIRVDVIHADLSQTQREDAVDNFRAGKTWVLIATDVISRGMDFKGINCVINYDFPESASAYIHRIGRTGRAGRVGGAITLYTEADIPFLRNIANVMAASGCEVPSWIMALPKLRRKKHRPSRESISTKPKDEEEEEE